MKFAKIAVFAIAFSFLGSFCMGMDQTYGMWSSEQPEAYSSMQRALQPKTMKIELENQADFTIYLKIKARADWSDTKPDVFNVTIMPNTTETISFPEGKIFTLRAWKDYSNWKKEDRDSTLYSEQYDATKIKGYSKFILYNNTFEAIPKAVSAPSQYGRFGRDETVSTSQLQPKQPTYYQQPTTSSTQAKVKDIEAFKKDFEDAVAKKSPEEALRVLGSYYNYGLTIDDLKEIRSGRRLNLLDLACGGGDNFLSVVKKLVDEFDFDLSFFIAFTRDKNYMSNTFDFRMLDLSTRPQIAEYLRSKKKFDSYFKKIY
jgi:hypothetical protein